jgi:competence protein ComEC
MIWNRFPFARILLPFLSGIIIAFLFGFTRPISLYFFIILYCIYAALVILIQQKLPYRLRWISGVVLIIFFLLSGYQLTVLKDSANQTDYFGKFTSQKGMFVCTLTEPIQEKDKTYKAIIEINSFKDSAMWHETSGSAIIYFEKDSLSQQLKYGDNILVSGNFNPVNPPMNPGEFNYKAYLKHRSIEYSAFIKEGSWKMISSDNGDPILKYAYSLRKKLLTILDKSEMSGREYGVISALLIGYTDKLDPDLIKDYQGSGAMHILSVSGMHVGVIYLVLNFFLFFFDKFRYGRVPKAVILILFVWCYAILTGLSPAILRAATMFSFIALGNAAKYPPNIINTVASSAFTLLVFNPNFLFDVGFQLSYFAVIGIVMIYPYIYKSWGSQYWLVDKIWSLIAVSIAAQLVTFPLSMYYFHQFPNYFIMTNIAAVPLSALVIYLGIAYLIFYSVPWLSHVLSKALTYSLQGLNNSISFIEGLPYSVSRAVSITGFEMILIYLVIVTVSIFLIVKKPRMLMAVLVILLVFMCSVSFHSFHIANQKKIIVYNISRHTAIDFMDGNECYFVTDSSLQNDSKKQEFHLSNSRIQYHTNVVGFSLLNKDSVNHIQNVFYKNQEFIYFAGKKMVIVNKAETNSKQIHVDFLLLSNNPKVSMDILLKQYKPGLVIMDASNYPKNIDLWIYQCRQRNIPYYATTRSGALVYEF